MAYMQQSIVEKTNVQQVQSFTVVMLFKIDIAYGKSQKSNLCLELEIVSKWVVVVSSGVQITEQWIIVPQSRVSSHFIEIKSFFFCYLQPRDIHLHMAHGEGEKGRGEGGERESDFIIFFFFFFLPSYLLFCNIVCYRH